MFSRKHQPPIADCLSLISGELEFSIFSLRFFANLLLVPLPNKINARPASSILRWLDSPVVGVKCSLRLGSHPSGTSSTSMSIKTFFLIAIFIFNNHWEFIFSQWIQASGANPNSTNPANCYLAMLRFLPMMVFLFPFVSTTTDPVSLNILFRNFLGTPLVLVSALPQVMVWLLAQVALRWFRALLSLLTVLVSASVTCWCCSRCWRWWRCWTRIWNDTASVLVLGPRTALAFQHCHLHSSPLEHSADSHSDSCTKNITAGATASAKLQSLLLVVFKCNLTIWTQCVLINKMYQS